MIAPALDRWLRYVLIGDGCWLWTGAKDSKGYGRFHFERRVTAAHRVGYELLVGPIPADLVGLHRCDNPPCVRPSHILPGTQQANVDDMRAKGRANYSKRLKLADAQEIRRVARDEQPSLAVLAERFHVSKSTVSEVLLGKSWPDGSSPIHIGADGVRHPKAKLSAAQVAEIRSARERGAIFKEIAATYGVSIPTARAAALGLSYRGEA